MKKIGSLPRAIEHARLLREKYLADDTRPGWHFAVPGDYGLPGDPNGAFFADGRYHLMYLYDCRSDSFRWGHISSADLLHWRAHPDAVVPDRLDGGIFSGGAFVDGDGVCYLSYWGLPAPGGGHGGIRLIRSCDRRYDRWEKFDDYALACTEPGILCLDSGGRRRWLGCADPSNIWRKGGFYYMQTGNLCVLTKFRRDGLHDYGAQAPARDADPDIHGDWVDLFRSSDLKQWEYLHRFYQRDASGVWTGADEDAMCPSFLPLPKSPAGGEVSGRYLQLFISHNRGCQYYIGSYDTDKDLFLPLRHGRMTWTDNTFFAPEALVDGAGRQIMWSWLLDNPSDEKQRGWSGVYGLPRSLWLREDGSLGIAPAEEIKNLRCRREDFLAAVPAEGRAALDCANGVSCEIILRADVTGGAQAGFFVRAAPDFSEYTKIWYDAANARLVFDASKSGRLGRPVTETAPLELAPGERLELDVFIDNSVVEVFANGRQAITRRVYPEGAESTGVHVFAAGCTRVEELAVYEMAPANFY